MKQFVNNITEDRILKLHQYDHDPHNGIVAYHTGGNSGWAVLVESRDDHKCKGFAYLRDLLRGSTSNLKFMSTPHGPWTSPIAKALDAGRKVYCFDDVSEFINYAADASGL